MSESYLTSARPESRPICFYKPGGYRINLFGLPCSLDASGIVIIATDWEGVIMADTPFHTVAVLTAHADSIKKLKAVILDFADPTRQEPGCLRFEVNQNCTDPARFTMIGDWTSEAAHELHLNASHTIEAFKSAGPLLGGEVEMRQYFAAQ